jgi:hypothetical protein
MDNLKEIEPYSFEFEGGVNNSYIFTTDHEIRYEIKFVPSGYIWEPATPFFKDNTFEFIIAILEKNKNPPLDKKIPDTIALIFKDFFMDKRNIVVYICDSSDNKQAIRFRKFNTWFHQYKGMNFMKLDLPIPEGDVTIFTSLIMRFDNPNKGTIMVEFDKLAYDLTENK